MFVTEVRTSFEVSIICITLLPKFPSKLLFGLMEMKEELGYVCSVPTGLEQKREGNTCL